MYRDYRQSWSPPTCIGFRTFAPNDGLLHGDACFANTIGNYFVLFDVFARLHGWMFSSCSAAGGDDVIDICDIKLNAGMETMNRGMV